MVDHLREATLEECARLYRAVDDDGKPRLWTYMRACSCGHTAACHLIGSSKPNTSCWATGCTCAAYTEKPTPASTARDDDAGDEPG